MYILLLNNDAMEHIVKIRMNYFHYMAASGICHVLDEDIALWPQYLITRGFVSEILLFVPIQYIRNIILARMKIVTITSL